jgi:hypothetical protein
MSFYSFFLTAEIQGETMVGFFYDGAFQINWDWRPYHYCLRETYVNYCYTQHMLPHVEYVQQILRVLNTRWLDRFPRPEESLDISIDTKCLDS